MNNTSLENSLDGIAVIGMSGRFPQARNIKEFWDNLKAGRESISFFSAEDARAAGVDESSLNDPNYVFAAGILEDIELFDADFFGLNPREAENLDPQQRLFLECSYEALEDAGYAREEYDYPIGVYGGSNMSYYFLYHLFNKLGIKDDLAIAVGNDKDYLATRVSYEFNLKGPSINIQTSCSTSMTAIAMAYEGLLNYHCDMAMAGGTGLKLPQKAGYLFQTGFIGSPDGHTRPFDAEANGTVFTSAVGVILLKRLEDAVRDGDHIYAVIKGMAVNNDGSDKVGFTAPSREGQTEVIAAAQNLAGVNPDDFSYIEAHGTGTSLGDPIEMSALAKVFEQKTQRRGYCAVGSVKGNIGHAISGAGVAGMIKTILALKHKLIPPTINFTTPNPKIDFENTPFFVNTQLINWENHGKPRLAGVSSFGFGGTNVHAVLEEAPERPESSKSNEWQLLTLSARTPQTLTNMARNLADYFQDNPNLNLADAVYTLHVGRREFQYRRALLCRSIDEAVILLAANEGIGIFNGTTKETMTGNTEVHNILAELKLNLADNLVTLAKLWVEGATVDWEEFHRPEKRLRLPLPTYPFDRKRYWVEQYQRDELGAGKRTISVPDRNSNEWLYFPSWKRVISCGITPRLSKNESWLIFSGEHPFSTEFNSYLSRHDITVFTAYTGEQYAKTGERSFTVNPGRKEDYHALIREVTGTGNNLKNIVHLWNVTGELRDVSRLDFAQQCQELGFYSLLYLAQVLGEQGIEEKIGLTVVTDNMHCIAGEKVLHPEKAVIIGPCKVIPREYMNISCRSIDLVLPESGDIAYKKIIEMVLMETTAEKPEFTLALRGFQRWVPNFEPIKLGTVNETALVKDGAVYLITGGLGGLGLAIAEYMACKAKIKLVLTRRSAFPGRENWPDWLANHDELDKTSFKIRQLMNIESLGSEIMTVNADISDLEQMAEVIQRVNLKFGTIDGVIHAAGIADNGLIAEKSAETSARVLTPKVKGTLVLQELFKGQKLDYFVLFSSSSAILGNAGFIDYCAANNFLDNYAHELNNSTDTYTVSINWDEWNEVGMAAENGTRDRVRNKITPREGLILLDKIVTAKPSAQIIVSSGDFMNMLENIRDYLQSALDGRKTLNREHATESNRPELGINYKAPENGTEAQIAEIWQNLLGISPVGVEDDFFDLGGHSLLATTVISELGKRFHRNISLQNLFENATVAQLARIINPDTDNDFETEDDYEEGEL